MKFGLVVDSCCELTQELKDALHATQVPLTLQIGEAEYTDDETLDLDAYVRALDASGQKQSSACPSPQVYCDAFLAQEAQEVFAITLSAKLSGSHNSAVLGARLAEEQGKKVHVVDSLSASAGELAVAQQVLQCAKDGLSFEDAIQHITAFTQRLQTYFILGNTQALVRNGRMPAVLGAVVNKLNVKLILGAEVGEGVIKLYGRARGFENGLQKIADLVAKGCAAPHDKISITHCNNAQGANQLAEYVRQRCEAENIVVQNTGGLSSMYVGPGGVIVAL